MKNLLAGISLLFLFGCAQLDVVIGSPFDAAEAQRAIGPGPNTIKGSGLMRQRGGGVVTCAGEIVTLTPATGYAVERFAKFYGPTDTGFTKSHFYSVTPDPAEFHNIVRTTKCDAQGNFEFDKVANGAFYLQTTILWKAGDRLQGGTLMQKVLVANGQSQSVVLSLAY